MASPALSKFSHRFCENGTIVSVCRKCFATVGAAHWEADLDHKEKLHVCDPMVLAHLYPDRARRIDFTAEEQSLPAPVPDDKAK